MYITELEIDNFKSFAKKTKIPFYEGFTVISGPNGSGKSNIIDSILFCLALSSARGLRAEKLTDLINLNSGKNTAEVSITFSDGTKVRRKIKRTPHGYYSYNYLDDRGCKQGDIVDLLSRHGIKSEGYNVVMQGDITRITEMSDVERRKIIDEIAGVAEFDKKRDQALSELEIVRERIEREELLLAELERRLKDLEKERAQAVKYREWSEKLEYFRSCHSFAKLKEKKNELGAIRELILSQKEEIEKINSKKVTEEEKIEELRKNVLELEKEINEKSGKEYLELLSEIESAKGRISVSEQTIVRLQQSIESNKETVQRVFMDKKRAESRVQECSDSLRSMSIDRSNLSMEVSGLRADLEDVEAKLQKESSALEGAKEKLFELMDGLEKKKGERSEFLNQQDVLIEKSRMRTDEKERLSSRIALIDQEFAEKSSLCVEYRSELKKLEDQKKTIDAGLSKAEVELFENRSALEKIRNEIRGLERDLMRLEAQQQASGGPGGNALDAVLGMDGVIGTVAQLGKAPAEYAAALDIAAGGRLRNVVVENDAVAADAIRFLKERRLGRMTFLPLNKLRAPESYPSLDKNVINYAVNLLDYDSRHDVVFRHVFGTTVVVDKMDTARKMIGRYRMVTLDGDLVEKAGAMTGGSQQKRISGFGVAADEEIKKLVGAISGLRVQEADLASAVERFTAEVDESRAKRSTFDEQMSRFRMLSEEYGRMIENLEDEKNGVLRRQEEIQGEVSGAGEKLAEIEGLVENISNEIQQIQDEYNQLRKRHDDTDLPALTESYEQLKKRYEEADRRLRNKDSDISDLQRERQHFQKRVEELDLDREKLETGISSFEEEISSCRQAIEENKEIIEDLEDKRMNFSEELNALYEKRDDLNEKILGVEKIVITFEAEVERKDLQIHSLGEKEKEVLQNIDELSEAAGDFETDLSLKEIEESLEESESALRKIGAVNMLAIEEYDRVAGRVEERSSKKAVLSNERTKIIERIEHYEKLKFDSFMEAYSAIDTNFRKIFARLTEGSGNLVLENEDDPFSGGMTFAVQPRGKKVHLLSALSGGEKSLTTLAFIFSIQQYMPAPFYALDEVDMMLDGSNVERVSKMIGELSANAQTICVSLRKPTVERADRIIGVTILPDKSTYVTGVKNNG
ncbi:chromosome segregation protein SMC [Methanolacinia petrolearia]|uniref:chromosome segregation protein SMC n=1 Tax=Methanolacinia petrolearia TaxID=54120 RepID=UPI003BA8643E